jgi:hypothetical protein
VAIKLADGCKGENACLTNLAQATMKCALRRRRAEVEDVCEHMEIVAFPTARLEPTVQILAPTAFLVILRHNERRIAPLVQQHNEACGRRPDVNTMKHNKMTQHTWCKHQQHEWDTRDGFAK